MPALASVAQPPGPRLPERRRRWTTPSATPRRPAASSSMAEAMRSSASARSTR
ncbi:hypothetical protein Rumeso_01135 [Rubellimicrobium mesophilum DSM 19309]|uniref:Uncharacterized protein n=1 Tax=Rubellimicrobium mesophilum DSM 19309 TaxID=442562 RepID=A0A017HSI2_9RHOB|nr:hypothetical protein Rumeso_01135 [Rubellimicrobium mesophilum DSM 19309]